MKIILLGIFLLAANFVCAEDSPPQGASTEPIVRSRNLDELNKESSSFMGDPDSLDPLPVKNENLKDDDEPVLEDIREVLNAPAVKKAKAKVDVKTNVKTKGNSGFAKPAKPAKKTIAKNNTKKKKKLENSAAGVIAKKQERIDDDPDIKKENEFHQIYKLFNAEPTSAELWSEKSAGRPANTYLIQKGDTLWSISETLFGEPLFWPKIWSLNREKIENPHFIYPGAQVVFYAGTDENSPDLAVAPKGAIVPEEGVEKTDALAEGDDDDENEIEDEAKPKRSKLKKLANGRAAPIPDSLPLYRNDRYFLKGNEVEVDLSTNEVPEDIIANDILLTDKKIDSEIEVTKEEMVKGRCGGEHLIHVSLKNNEGDLAIFESLESLPTDSGDVYSYRRVGTAKIINSNRIKITSCSSVLSSALVFIPPSLIGEYRSQKISNQSNATLIGGPGLGTQKIFSSKQIAYVNLGVNAAEIGQIFGIKSQLTEQQSGEIKLIEKFGSFGIGLITDVQDLVENGDELLLK